MKRSSFKWCVYTFLCLGIGMVSCADEDLMTYEDVPRIYFKYADASSSDFGEMKIRSLLIWDMTGR